MAGEQEHGARSPEQPEPAAPEQPESESEAQSEQGAQGEQGAQESPTDDPAALRREAAGYRRRLREAEGNAERLTEQLEALQRQAIEAQVSGAGRLADGSDLWLTGVTLADLRDEDGAINAEKVNGALERTLAEHPAWKDKTHPGLGGGARGTGRPTAPSFGEALKNPSLRRNAR